MSRGEEKAKRWRWRPRFSVRTLVIFVTLVCAYFGAWEATKKWGCKKVDRLPIQWVGGETSYADFSQRSPAPFIVCGDEPFTKGWSSGYRTTYYLWLFGPKIKLPFKTEL